MVIGMDINSVLETVDEFYEKNQGAEAEKLLLRSAEQAAKEQDNGSLLQLLNELLGYYRETGQKEASFQIAEKAVSLALKMGLDNSIPYATTLLNVANAYRAGGETEKSLECYLKVQEIYESLLEPENMLVAGLQNNMSLLYQEMGNFKTACACLEKALAIVEKKDAEFEIAVTCANLAGTCMQLDRKEEAYRYALRSIDEFEKMNVQDAHYSAALSALGTYYYEKKEYEAAMAVFKKAMGIVEASLGKNEHYRRLLENVQACEAALEKQEAEGAKANYTGAKCAETKCSGEKGIVSGRLLCRAYYEEQVRPMLEKQFSGYLDKIAVGLVGEGSDCFGFDDRYSMDHDWGADVCLWLTEETWNAVGEALEQAYEQLPKEQFLREKLGDCADSGQIKSMLKNTDFGQKRRGVMKISDFYRRLLQADCYEEIDWRNLSDASLAAAVNGEVYRDDEGVFSAFREKLLQGYPEEIRYLKLAEAAAGFAQSAQYNYGRMKKRGDLLTAHMMLSEGMRQAMKLMHYIEGKYPLHDKWLYRSTKELAGAETLCALLEEMDKALGAGKEEAAEGVVEQIASFLAKQMYDRSFISDTEAYLDAHTRELLYKAQLTRLTDEELVENIAQLEFKAFDKVQNKGGRASCQNDWATFSIMRKSQYLTWNRIMLMQYLYDFNREFSRGHNLIEEKYGRMMESTAPQEYEEIKERFPVLSEEKKQIIEQIVALQVAWMEAFAEEYPHLADNARSVHTYEDNLYNTSYETYLRGELGTYSDKMLELYGRYVVNYAVENRNPAYDIMTNSAKLYGYRDLAAAEAFLKL